jgi:hypothetical protein
MQSVVVAQSSTAMSQGRQLPVSHFCRVAQLLSVQHCWQIPLPQSNVPVGQLHDPAEQVFPPVHGEVGPQ